MDWEKHLQTNEYNLLDQGVDSMDGKSGTSPDNMDIEESQNDGWATSEEITDEVGEQNVESRKSNINETCTGNN